MRKISIATWMGIIVSCFIANVTLADNCSSPGDCMQTAGYNATVALVGGVLGLVAALLGSRLAEIVIPIIPTFSLEHLKGKGGYKTADNRDNTYDSSRPKRKWRHVEKRSTALSVGASYSWLKPEDKEVVRWGDDTGSIKLDSYGYEVSSGYQYKKDISNKEADRTHSFDILKGEVHGTLASAEGKETYFHDHVAVEGSLKLANVEAETSAGLQWSKKSVEAHVKAGGSFDLAKIDTTLSGSFSIGTHSLTAGVGFEGQVGASAEGKLSGGVSDKQGSFVSGKVKAGLGAGFGVSFSINFK